MRTWLQDLRYGVRRLAATPTVTLAAVLSLALAVGANGAIFGAVKKLLLEPLPYHEPHRLVRVWGTYPEGRGGQYSLSYPNYRDLARAPTLDGLAAYRASSFTLAGPERPERVVGVATTADLFRVLGVRPALGRGFLEDEDGPEGERVVVLSHELWQRSFQGDRSVLGRSVSLDGEPYTVVGVMPEGFSYPLEAGALWLPLLQDESTWHRASGGLSTVGRLAPGAEIEALRTQLREIARPISVEFSRWYEGWSALTRTLPRAVYGADVRLMLHSLLAAVFLLLVIACINVANLLLARATARRREVAVRSALGAARSRVVRLFLLESLALGAAGGLLGLAGAEAGIRFLRRTAPEGISRVREMAVDPWVAGGTLALGLVVGLLFGVLPALQGARTDVAGILQRGSSRSHTEGRSGRRTQQALVTAQVVLVLVVLTGAGLMTRTVARLGAVDPGFDPAGTLAFAVSLTSEYDESAEVSRFQAETLRGLRALPSVRAAGAVNTLPLAGPENFWNILVEEGPEAGDEGPRASTGANYATPGYFESMGIPVLRGRAFTGADRPDSPPVVVVSQAMAEHFWPEQDALGKRVALPGESTPDRPGWRTVVGVVENVRHGGLRDDPRGEIYLPWPQLPWAAQGMVFTVSGSDGAGPGASSIREVVRAVDPGQAVYDVTPLRELVAAHLAGSRGLARLLGLFGGVALLLASVGVFGVAAHAVARRRHEIGIRTALGAARDQIVGMVVRQGLAPVALGLVLGLPASVLGAGLLRDLLFQVDPVDPLTYVAVPTVLLLVALAAVWIPARRATRVDPVDALRRE